MLQSLPYDVLVILTTYVACNSVKDMCNLMVTCTDLWNACNDEKALCVCSLEEMPLIPLSLYDELGQDSFLKRLESARNPYFFFRLGLINLVHESPRMIIVKNYFQKAHLRGHDAAMYALAILEICGGKWEDIQKGSAFLHELWTNGCLLECRRQIEEARKIDGFWPEIREWWSELHFGGVCYVHTISPKVPILRWGITVSPIVHRYRKGVLVGSADGDYYYDATCVACLLNEEIEWFLEKLGFQDPFL